MAYSNQNAAFFSDKKDFFSQITQHNTTKAIDMKVMVVSQSFLLDNQASIESEFNSLFYSLNTLSEKNKDSFWLYCYYCASLLESFYTSYVQKEKQEHFKDLKLKILKRINKEKEDSVSEKAFINSLCTSFVSSLKNLATAPAHASQSRDYVAMTNLYRLYWVFSRLTMTQGLLFAQELGWLDKLKVDHIISGFQAPSTVLNYLSVALFLMRSMIDFGLLLKHTFFPTETEKNDTTWQQRFKYEFYKRHCNFANDLTWATVNFLTNLNHIAGIPGSVTGYIIAPFLGFDIGMALYKLVLAKQEYLIKKVQYLEEIELCKQSSLSEEEKAAQIEVLQMQIKHLNVDWETKQAKFYFLAAAAALLMIGFSASLILTPPMFAALCYFTCFLGVSMYCSTGAYSDYREKGLLLDLALESGVKVDAAQKEFDIARNEFFYTMTKNTLVPMLLITTYALCWPAAVVLTGMYMGYELFHGYNQHTDKVEAKQLAQASA